MDVDQSREVFATSEHIRRLWPKSLITPSLHHLAHRNYIHDLQAVQRFRIADEKVGSLSLTHRLIGETPLVTAPLWSLGSSTRMQEIVRDKEASKSSPFLVQVDLGHSALSNREFDAATRHYGKALEHLDDKDSEMFRWVALRCALAFCLDGRMGDARALVLQLPEELYNRQLLEDREHLLTEFELLTAGTALTEASK